MIYEFLIDKPFRGKDYKKGDKININCKCINELVDKKEVKLCKQETDMQKSQSKS